jgi:hypothetical protein
VRPATSSLHQGKPTWVLPHCAQGVARIGMKTGEEVLYFYSRPPHANKYLFTLRLCRWLLDYALCNRAWIDSRSTLVTLFAILLSPQEPP